jgi:transcriptional regulator with XRE-family HTH domain
MEPNRRVFPAASPIRRRRLAKGITLSEAARAAGVSLTKASYVERGLGKADPKDLRRLDEAIERLAAVGP